MLANLKAKLAGSLNKFTGNKDALEAVCAAAALTAAADGEISDAELAMTTKVVSQHATLSKAYKTNEIEKCIDTMLKRAQSGRTGRFGLYKEIEQIANDTNIKEEVYLCALDIAETDGKVEQKEREVLNEIAKRLGLQPSSYSNV